MRRFPPVARSVRRLGGWPLLTVLAIASLLASGLAIGAADSTPVVPGAGPASSPPVAEQTPSTKSTPPAVPLELLPYRVRFAANPHGECPLDAAALHNAARRGMGDLWETQWNAETKWCRSTLTLQRLTAKAAKEDFPERLGDFWCLLHVSAVGARYKVVLRGWQPRTDSLSPLIEGTTEDRRRLVDLIVSLARDCFRPVTLVDQVKDKQVRLRIRGGDLPTAAPDEYQLLKPKDVLAPAIYFYGKGNKPDRVMELPWTLLEVVEVRGAVADCQLHSGLKLALGGKQRGKAETLALRVHAWLPGTQLELWTQTKPPRPMAAQRIDLRHTLPGILTEREDETVSQDFSDPPREMLTDRRGGVQMLRDVEQPLTWVTVHSGTQILARVPCVPGSVPSMRLDLPDDSVRLTVEGELQILQARLIDTVAERNTLMAAVRLALKNNQRELMKTNLRRIEKLPSAQRFLDRIAGIRVKALQVAKQRKDRVNEGRIKRMCADVEELVRNYLSDDKHRALLEEIGELQQAPQEDQSEDL